MRIFFVIALLTSLCLVGGCARKVRVEVNAFVESGEMRQAGRLAGQRCLVLPAGQDVSPDDLQFREFSARVGASLAHRGCAPAQGLEDADLAILLAYGISEPYIVEERSHVAYRPWGRWSRHMAEYLPVTTTYIFNIGRMRLEARLVEKAAAPPGGAQKDGASPGPKAEEGAKLGRQVWKIDAAHAGQGIDLRALFPWLLAAAGNYFGVDSGQTVLVRVHEEDLASVPPAKHIASTPGTDAL